ncbi:MAG: alpha/beta fold hydrolase [Phycisphaeraceae bacterium]|nr:alpha/beta fold hydrolase [Phycisphaeraceae bacterium]
MFGVVTLILIGALLAWLLAVMGVALEALRPRRRTLAWALTMGSPADPEELPDMKGRFRLHHARLSIGLEVPCWDLEGLAPAGPLVVIVHGWGRSRWDSLRRAPLVLPHASRVLLPDLRGHGEARGLTRLGSIEADDLIALLNERGALDAGAPPIVVIGHSMGAGIAVRAALRSPAIRAVIALAPYNRVRTPISARLTLRGLPSALLVRPSLMVLRTLGVRDDALTDAAAGLLVPLTVISAESDLISPAQDGRAIAARVPEGRGTSHLLPGSDHAEPGTAEPERYAKLVVDALVRVTKPSSGEGS